MNFIDILKQSFMNSWTGGSSIDPGTGKIGKPNRFHGKDAFKDFEFKDLFDNDRWVREKIGDPNPKSDRQQYTHYYNPRIEYSSSTDLFPTASVQPKEVPVSKDELDLDISSGRIPIDSRSIPGNRWSQARIPDPRSNPRYTPAYRQVGQRPPVPLLGQQGNLRTRLTGPPSSRPPVTGPYNPHSLESYASYNEQRQREMARRQAIQNQRRTIRVPQDRNTAEAMRRAMGGYGQRTPPQTSLLSQGDIANDSVKRLAMDAASIARWVFPRTGAGAMLYSPDVGDPNETADDAYWRTGGSVFPQTPGPYDPTEKVVTTQDSKGTKVVRTQQYPAGMPSTINDTRESGQVMNIERLREMLGEAYFKRLFQ